MKIALSNLFTHATLEEALGKISAMGYRHVELFDCVLREPGFDVGHLRSLLSRHRLSVCSVSTVSVKTPLINDFFAGPDEDRRAAAAANMKRAVRFARELDCGMVTTELTGNVGNVGRVDQQLSRGCFLKSIEEVMPTLEAEDVSISFEPHPGDFIEDSNPAVDFLRSIGSPRIGYLWCASHSFVLGGPALDLLRYAADLLSFVYVSDSPDRRRLMDPRLKPEVRVHGHLIPGEGQVDFDVQFALLKELGYEGFVCAQPFSYSEDMPEEAAVRSLEYLRKLMKRHGIRP